MTYNQKFLQERINQGGCDLHMHSTESDGTLTPTELAAAVIEKGLQTVALTDHDNLSGIEEMQSALYELAKDKDIRPPVLIPGTELSVDGMGGELHLLAYFPDGKWQGLMPYLERQNHSRTERNIAMCKRLTDLGYPVTYDEVCAESQGEVIARPHFARVLVKKGFVVSISDAFNRLLGDGKPGYMNRVRPTVSEAIFEIKRLGGLSVLAHPYQYGWVKEPEKLKTRLRQLATCGLDGVEVVHGQTPAQAWRVIADCANDLGLIKTMGSDFHGANKPGLDLYSGSEDHRDLLFRAG